MRESSDVWTGRARSYDDARPTPPSALPDLLTQLISLPHPALVVDLGSGTGLSTAIWAADAERVLGIEPNADMREHAAKKIAGSADAARIAYRDGTAQQTGLPPAAPTSSLRRNLPTGWSRSRPWPRSRVSSGPAGFSPSTITHPLVKKSPNRVPRH